ncbi:MAG: ABC transporter permease [Eubacterium sp.]|nr:ABC transporter permease [Eubacterium sp.]
MFENIRLSFQGIFGHKLRSFLTMLGIIIGIAAIIAIVSTIKGTNDQIKENLVGSGSNIVQVNLSQGGIEITPSDGYNLDHVPIVDDKISEKIMDIESVIDMAKYHKASVWQGVNRGKATLSGCNIIGGNNKYVELMGYSVVAGREFVDNDYLDFRNVVILDQTSAYGLFEGEDPVGGTIEIKGYPFVVVGIVEKLDDFEPVINSIEEWDTYYGNETSGVLIVPDTCWPVLYQYDEPYQIIVKAKDTESMTSAGKETQDLLNGYIKDSNEDAVRYKSEDTLEKAKELQKLSSATSKQLLWIASISLLVGGIGVMNIMLVSVTERTREIGLKKALGARKRSILGQFLTEAAVLTSIGGLIGVGAGIGLAYFISKVAEVPVSISIPATVISVVFSMMIGIIFGLIPSVKASNLNPIDALRYE